MAFYWNSSNGSIRDLFQSQIHGQWAHTANMALFVEHSAVIRCFDFECTKKRLNLLFLSIKIFCNRKIIVRFEFGVELVFLDVSSWDINMLSKSVQSSIQANF